MWEVDGKRMEEVAPVAKLPCEHSIEPPVSVHAIEEERMTDTGKMPADLMAAPRLDHCFDVRRIGEPAQHPVPRERWHGTTRARRERRADGTALTANAPSDERAVDLLPSMEIGILNTLRRLPRPCKQHDAGSVEIQAVHGAQTRILLPQEIEQRQLAESSLATNNKFTGKFVHNQEMLILIEDAIGGDRHAERLRVASLLIQIARTNFA